jgi:hypothetical protein
VDTPAPERVHAGLPPGSPTIVSEGVFYLPLENARLVPVDIEDIAQAAFALLHGDGHGRRAYEITGPEVLTMDQLAERLSRALGKTVRYVNVAPEDKRRALLAAGVPLAFADALDELFSERRRAAPSRRSTSAPTRSSACSRPRSRTLPGGTPRSSAARAPRRICGHQARSHRRRNSRRRNTAGGHGHGV